MVFLSIVIPAYNCQKTILPLLSSLTSSRKVKFAEIEIVVVDDRSTDESGKVVKDYLVRKGRKFKSVKIVSLRKNQGPAHARNVGVRYANGKVILFLDADVILHSNTLYEVIRSFKNDPDLYALTGVWDKKQKSRKFFPQFKALRDWSYWINERDPKNYYYLFSTRIAAINRELFLRLGGFDETYKAALVEDIELTYRIARRYAVVFNPKVIVHHEFEDFLPIAKKYFWRSFYWSRIYRERKKFDPVATTSKEAVTTMSAGLLVIFSLLYIVLGIMYYVLGIKIIYFDVIKYLILNTLYVILIVHLFGVRKFLWFCLREEGIWFMIRAFITGVVLYLVILAGAGTSFLSNYLFGSKLLKSLRLLK